MKRLLCLISNMNTGGAETFMMKIYRQLDHDKYQIDFCLNTEEEAFYNHEITTLGGKIYYVPAKSQDVSKFVRKLASIIRNEKYEYVLRITSNAAGFMDLKVAKKAGAKICVARSSNSSDGRGLKTFVAHRLGRLLYSRYVDIKIAPSDLAAKYTFGSNAIKKGEVKLLCNALDLEVYHYYDEQREKVRKEFNIEGKKVVGHIGRFVLQKNHEFLLDIFDEIRKIHQESMLLLVGGNGNAEKKIREKIEQLNLGKYVVFAGIRADIPQILSAMDVLVMPSLYEGMPNTVIEAQATGLPCVIADTITREANITGLVEYMPLGDAKRWAMKALEMSCVKRIDTKDVLRAKGYDIQKVADEFVKMVFEKR